MSKRTEDHPRDGQFETGGGLTLLLMRLGVALAVASMAVLVGSANANATSADPLDDAILATAPAYYYPLTTNAADASGHGNPALTTADVWDHTGGAVAFAGAANFDGTAYLAGGPAPSTAGDFAVGAWFTLPGSFLYDRTILSAQGWTIDVGVTGIGWRDRGGIFVHADVAGTGEHQVIASEHAGTLTLYLDGKAIGTTTSVAAIVPHELSVGSLYGQADFNALVGSVSHVAGWTSAVTPTQVAAMYAARTGHAPAVRVCHRWSMMHHLGRGALRRC